ncbi:MAG TPA: YbjN domain-containing protein [Micromonosporaceae bacterium]
MTDLRETVTELIRSTLEERGLDWDHTGEWSYVAILPGTRKYRTNCNLIVGEHALRVEAFVMRQPDENREQLWEWLLQRNATMYGVAFAVDRVGDVYLTGRVALHSITADELDRLLGSVLRYVDDSFNTMLEIGFGTSIRREYEWRVKRGESLENLKAFSHLFEPTRSEPSGPGRSS